MRNAKQIAKTISGLKTRNRSLRRDVQAAAIEVCGHVFDNGETSLVDKLVDAMEGNNLRALMAFFQEYGFTRFNQDGTSEINKKARKEAGFADGDEVIAYLTNEAKDWWTMGESKEGAARALNVATKVEAIAKQVEKAQEEGREVQADRASLESAIQHLTSAVAAIDAA